MLSEITVGDIVWVPPELIPVQMKEPQLISSSRSIVPFALVVQVEPDGKSIVANIGVQWPWGQYYYNCYGTGLDGCSAIQLYPEDVKFDHRHRLYDQPYVRDLFSIVPREICEITPFCMLLWKELELPCQINRCDSSISTVGAVRIQLAYGSLDHIVCEMGLCHHHAHYDGSLPRLTFPIRTLWDEFDGRSQSYSLSA